MKKVLTAVVLPWLTLACSADRTGTLPAPDSSLAPIRLQLNWFHDPTFAGEYLLADDPSNKTTIAQGGPTINPVQMLASGVADAAVMGADIFLKTVAEDVAKGKPSELVAVFVDFQRNPVGWILHPSVARQLGYQPSELPSQRDKNGWLFKELAAKRLRIGDKRGTETTSIWVQWRKIRQLPPDVFVMPVGFDPEIVLTKAALAFPVYLNEEPLKLGERIGEPVVVFDPAADGIELYGNVVVFRRAFLIAHKDTVRHFQSALQKAWIAVREDRAKAVALTKEVYPDVSDAVLGQQLERTVQFVFHNASQPGIMDARDGGAWSRTVGALVEAQLLPPALDMKVLREHLFPLDGPK